MARRSKTTEEQAPDSAVSIRRAYLKTACFVRPSSIKLIFADGFERVCTFEELRLVMDDINPSTIKAKTSGSAILMESKSREILEVDSTSLRAAVDKEYAAELDADFARSRGPLENITTNATSLPKR